MSATSPDFEYKGHRGFYLAIDLKARTLTVGGSAARKSKADSRRIISFDAVRGARTFMDAGFFLTVQGIELELEDLETPVLRVAMTPRDQSTWMARIGQVCELK